MARLYYSFKTQKKSQIVRTVTVTVITKNITVKFLLFSLFSSVILKLLRKSTESAEEGESHRKANNETIFVYYFILVCVTKMDSSLSEKCIIYR